MTSRSNLVSVTHGMANALMKGHSPSRACSKCGKGVPAYPGRYPSKCPTCGGAMERCTESLLAGVSPSFRLVLEAGIRAGVPWAGDESCSPAVVVPLSVVGALVEGGLPGFLRLLEGPGLDGRYFRVEDPWSPVLIAEVSEAHNSLSVYASDNPEKWLGSDPRLGMIEDGGWTVAGWEELDEYAGIVDGRAKSDETFPDGFMDDLLQWVARYARKGALIKGEPGDDYIDLVIPVYSLAQLDLAELGKRYQVTIEIGLYDQETGVRWHPLGESAREAQMTWKDAMPGGKADKRKPADFDADQLAKGVAVELEHTDDVKVATEIAMDHLSEDPRYYTKLAKLHKDEVCDDEDGEYAEACGIFIPVPSRLHGKFPERPEEDQSDPHVTLCYLGHLSAAQYAAAVDVLSQVCKGLQPFVIEMTDYGEFTAAKGRSIAHMIPRSVGGPPFETIHERLVTAMRAAGIPVDHHRDNAFKPHITLDYLEPGETYSGPRPDGYWRCESLELWGGTDGEFGNIRCTFGTGDSHLVETGGTGGAGALSRTTRARVIRPVAGYGDDGAATRAHGGFRFQVGANRRRKPNKNVQLSIQNRKNAQRGLAKRIKAAKQWHASQVGRRMHRDLGRYNTGNQKGNQITRPGGDGAPSGYSGALAEDYHKVVQNLDDAFDGLIRKLIRIESLDVLQDADFDEENGAVYLYFDPLLTRDEVDLILSILKEENAHAELVGSPERELPGELLRADWWVVWAPYREAQDGMTLVPDPRYYATDPHDRSKGAPAPQTFVKAALSSVDQIAQQIDVTQLVQAIGESARLDERGPLLMFWSDADRRTPQLKGAVSGAAGDELPRLMEAAACGHGTLFLIRARDSEQARTIIQEDDLFRLGPAMTNDREMTR